MTNLNFNPSVSSNSFKMQNDVKAKKHFENTQIAMMEWNPTATINKTSTASFIGLG